MKKYEQILMKQENSQLTKKRAFIMGTLMPGEEDELSVEKMSKIAYYFHKRKCTAGDVIYRENDPINHVFLVKSGEVELQKEVSVHTSDDDTFHGTVRVSKLSTREFFGDCDVFYARSSRFFTAVASTAATIFYCEVNHFVKCIEEIKQLIEQFTARAQMKHQHRLKVIAEATHTRNFVKDLQGFVKSKRKRMKQQQKSSAMSPKKQKAPRDSKEEQTKIVEPPPPDLLPA